MLLAAAAMGAVLTRLLWGNVSAIQNWARLVGTMLRIFFLRRLWAALGHHLRRYTQLRARAHGPAAPADDQADQGHSDDDECC